LLFLGLCQDESRHAGLANAATSAGFAMACPFGSSAELEAAMIARRREAAARLRKRRRGYALAATTAVLLVFVLLG
jgi:DNA invertase Pin-like site-specific DNA recombinase